MQPILDFATRYPITALLAWGLLLLTLVKIVRLPFAHFQLLHSRRTNQTQEALRAPGQVVNSGAETKVRHTPGLKQRYPCGCEACAGVESISLTRCATHATAVALLDALKALGAWPDGYCFCRTPEQAKAGHTGECRDAVVAIAKTESRSEGFAKTAAMPRLDPLHDARCKWSSCHVECPVYARLSRDPAVTHGGARECGLSHSETSHFGPNATHWCALTEGHNKGEAEIWHQDREGTRFLSGSKKWGPHDHFPGELCERTCPALKPALAAHDQIWVTEPGKTTEQTCAKCGTGLLDLGKPCPKPSPPVEICRADEGRSCEWSAPCPKHR